MQKTNVTPAELQQAKALLLRQIPLAESSEDAVAGGIVSRARVGLPLDEPMHAAERYFNMTADQVRAAFAKWIDPANFVQVVRGDPTTAIIRCPRRDQEDEEVQVATDASASVCSTKHSRDREAAARRPR